MRGFLKLFLLAKVSRYCKKLNLFPQYLIVSEFVLQCKPKNAISSQDVTCGNFSPPLESV